MFPRFAITTAIMHLDLPPNPESDRTCKALCQVSIVTSAFATLPPYLFLWIRQRTLYQQPLTEHMYTRIVKILNWGSISFLILTSVVASSLAIIVVPVSYTWSTKGCTHQLTNHVTNSEMFLFSHLGSAIGSQMALVALLIYPLVKQSQIMKTRTYPFIRGAVISAVICMTSDTLTMLFVELVVYPSGAPGYVALNLRDINMFIDVVSIFFAFGSPHKIVCFLCHHSQDN